MYCSANLVLTKNLVYVHLVPWHSHLYWKPWSPLINRVFGFSFGQQQSVSLQDTLCENTWITHIEWDITTDWVWRHTLSENTCITQTEWDINTDWDITTDESHRLSKHDYWLSLVHFSTSVSHRVSKKFNLWQTRTRRKWNNTRRTDEKCMGPPQRLWPEWLHFVSSLEGLCLVIIHVLECMCACLHTHTVMYQQIFFLHTHTCTIIQVVAPSREVLGSARFFQGDNSR